VPLANIVGHTHLIDLLRTAIARDRVPQSLLFAGPDGVGKRATAIALAQAVNCPAAGKGRPVPDACGVCPTCQRIARGVHSDVVLIEKGDEASIKIGTLRTRLLEVAGYRPFEARRRVFIIDPAEEMTAQAQDSLLKTLEEPPSGSMLILISAYADTLLATVQSRCRRLRFGVLREQDVARVLTERCEVEAKEARLLAATAGGSVSRALAGQEDELEGDREAALSLLAASAGRPVVPRLRAAAALAKHESKRRDRDALASRLALLGTICRDVTALHAGAGADLVNADLADRLQGLQRAFSADRLSRAFAALDQAQKALERNASPKIVADWVAVRI
jgi:DNA polymerase-3 subunit delta'